MMPPNHEKDMIVAGCRVHLAFSSTDSRWSVQGTVDCGLEENSGRQSFVTGSFPTREAAEQDALSMVNRILGHNVDRSTSRVLNWS
jgi:hypothetical protein